VQRPIITGALPDGGWQMLVVPMEQVSVAIDPSWWRPLGMRASASYRVDFSDVIVEKRDLLGAPGDYHLQPWLSAGAIRFAAVQLGGAQALLDATRAFLQRLGRTGDPYQQQRIGQATIAVESGNLWLEGAAREVDLGPRAHESGDVSIQRTIAYGNMVRLAIEEICERVMGVAQHSAGARALLQPDPIERIIRDLTLYLRQPAPDAALAQVGRYALECDQ
jgi:alkylation response protein AidB-like acyl-CoA dehydrogenase